MAINNRNVIKSLILTLLSCGIYGIYWSYLMISEGLAVSQPNHNVMLEVILAILPPFLGFYSVEKKFAKMCEANGIEHTDRSLTFLILGFVPFGWFVIAAMFQAEFNKIKSIIG